MNHQTDWRDNRTSARQADIKRFIEEQFDLPGLKKIGFIESSRRSTKNLLAIERRIVEFFGFENIYQYTQQPMGEFMKADPNFFKQN